MKKIASALFVSILIILGNTGYAQISGTVFRDFNGNGVRNDGTASTPIEPYIPGIVVKATLANGNVFTTTTNSSGAYSFTVGQIPAASPVRIEFSSNDASDAAAFNGSDNGTNVQFVTAPSAAVNFALSYPGWYSNTTNPWLATTRYTAGNSSATAANESGTFPNLIVRAHNATGDGTATTNTTSNQYTGSVFGLAYQRQTRKLFMAAYFKRLHSFGPGGIGGIYTSDINQSTGAPSNPTLFVDVTTIGINVGTDVAARGLPNLPGTSANDVNAFAEVGRRGIGDMDISDDGKKLYLINMFQGKIHRIFINNPAVTPTAGNVTEWVIPTPTLTGATTNFRPMAIKVWKNRIFIGGVCIKEITANQSVADTAGMKGLVYEFNETTGTFTTVLTFPLTYKKGYSDNNSGWQFRTHYWSAWQNSTTTSVLQYDALSGGNAGTYPFYAQPMLSDIEFDVNGDMIIGMRDRWGDQMGWQNYMPNGTTGYNAIANAEMLRAGICSGSTWTIESNASVCSGTATGGANLPGFTGYFNTNNVGPGTGTSNRGFYYFMENPPTFNHQFRYLGGLALLAGSNLISSTAMDPWASTPGTPSTAFNTTGFLHTYNQTLGANNAGTIRGGFFGGLRLINDNGNQTPGKSAGLGDLELLTDPEPIQIGNRIWNDANANGIQDPGETVAGVPTGTTVTLRSPGVDGIYGNGDDQTWTTTTDANGNYYFSALTGGDNRKPAGWVGVGNTILPGYEYRIEVAVPANNRVTLTDAVGTAGDNIDNDASLSGSNAIVVFNTSNTSHNFDIGFTNTGAIGNRVWLDNGAGTGGIAGDGIQNGNEPGVAGISVTLFRDNNNDGDFIDAGELYATTVTDAYGNYLFEGLPGGVNPYRIEITPPVNYTFTLQTNTSNDQGNDATGSDVNPVTGRSYNIILTIGEVESDIDTGLQFSQPVTQSIGDKIWLDNGVGGGTAGNGVQDGTEPGMAGVVVSLYFDADNNGSISGTEATIPYRTTFTDASGNYTFTNLPVGNYQVAVTLPAGFTFTGYNAGGGTLGTVGESNTDSDIQTSGAGFGRSIVLALDATENLINVDGGLITTASNSASIGDFIWNDLDQDGVQDTGEPGLSGVTVTLYAANGTTVLATTISDAFGGYSFTELTGGTSYVIGITPPGGFTVSPQNVGSDLLDNDINAGSNKTAPVLLPNGIRNMSVDAGLYQNSPAGTARMGDRVWFDNGIGGGTAANGVQDGTEPGIAGVTVKLYQNGPDGIAGTTDDILLNITATDINGNYQFVNLAASTGPATEYNIDFSNLPPGYSFTPVWSSNDANATNSDANPGTGRTGSINLSAGESEQDVDAGLIADQSAGNASLGNKVFIDLNGNGIQNTGETGIAGVLVTLQKDLNNDGDFLDAGEASFATQLTNSLGEYLFTGLDAGSYRVIFSNGPAGYNISPANAGTDDAVDSDGNNAGAAISTTSSTTGIINLSRGEDNLTVDLGIVKTTATNGSISDRVWFDINSDGIRAANEPGIEGVTVTLYNAAGIVLAISTSDENGYYLFDNLAAATYSVGFSNYPAGLIPTNQTVAITNDYSAPNLSGRTPQIVLASSQNRTDVDFGLRSTRSSLGNFVWLDKNGDGVQDMGEPGIPGVTVLLYYDANNDGDFLDAGENVPVTSMITDQNGQYLFTNLNSGNYQVEFTTVPSGLNFTQQNTPGDNSNNTNSDAGTTGRTPTINLTIGEADLTIDAGLYKPIASVGNYIWADNNGNNIQDAGDQGVAGVLVTLYTSGGIPVSATVTDKNGFYQFINVAPGNYYLGFSNTPGGVFFVTADQGGNDALDSDVTGTNGAGTTALFNVPQASVNITLDAGLIYLQTLPVKIQFTARKNNTVTNLSWQVTGADDVLRYEVERSADGLNFNLIFSALAGANNFNHIDLVPLKGINYYRIRIVNADGSVKYSEVRIVIFNSSGSIFIFPNPASDKINIQLPENWQGKNVSVIIFNQLGQIVMNKQLMNVSQVEALNVNKLPVGIFTIQLINNEGIVENRKLQIKK